MQGKVLRFFPSPPSYIHGLQNSYESFNKSFAFLTLKLSLAAYSEMDESTLLNFGCRDDTFGVSMVMFKNDTFLLLNLVLPRHH